VVTARDENHLAPVAPLLEVPVGGRGFGEGEGAIHVHPDRTRRHESHQLFEVGAWIVPAASDEVAELESMDQGRSDQTCIAIMGY
jgi:hypothetical protein